MSSYENYFPAFLADFAGRGIILCSISFWFIIYLDNWKAFHLVFVLQLISHTLSFSLVRLFSKSSALCFIFLCPSFMEEEDIPIAYNNQYLPRASYCRKLFVSLMFTLFLWTERAKAFLPLPGWPDLKALQQNLSTHRSVQVCLDLCDPVLCESKTTCFIVRVLKGLRWLMALLWEH